MQLVHLSMWQQSPAGGSPPGEAQGQLSPVQRLSITNQNPDPQMPVTQSEPGCGWNCQRQPPVEGLGVVVVAVVGQDEQAIV
jgi:hypothetical protein